MAQFKNIREAVTAELKPASTTVVNLNFKLEGATADHFKAVAATMGKNNTELAKFILTHALSDVMDELGVIIEAGDVPAVADPGGRSDEVLERELQGAVESALIQWGPGAQFELPGFLGPRFWGTLQGSERLRIGRIFRRKVEAGEFPEIELVGKKANNHLEYRQTAVSPNLRPLRRAVYVDEGTD